MAVNIIVNISNTRTSSRVGKYIRRLVNVIPGEHLIGLEKIIITDDNRDARFKGRVAGLYQPKHQNEKPYIVISYSTLFSDIPAIIRSLPFFFKLTLGSTLFHEIGHHYHHQLKHGITKSNREEFAREYRKKMLGKAFWGWRIIIRPLAMVLRVFTKK